MDPKFSSTLRSMALGISLAASLAAAQTSPLQANPASLSYSFSPGDAPADRTVVVTNTGSATVTASILTTQTGQPVAATAFTAEAASAPDLGRIYSNEAMSADFSTDRVIVVFKDGLNGFSSAAASDAVTGGGEMRELAAARFPGGQKAHKGNRIMLSKLKKRSRQAVLDAIQAIRVDPNVAYVQPDYVLHATETPNDPDFNKQWHLENTGQTGGFQGADVHATAGWNKQKNARKIVIGLIDSGIDYLHPDLADNIWTNPGEIPGNGIDDDDNGYIDDVHGWDFVSNDADPMDDNMHGTHCAGIIAAEGNNATGVSGVAWQAQLMALKFLDSNGSGYTSAAINAINYAKAMGVKITSNSWGGGPFDQALMDAIAGSGALFIAAAGNNSQNVDAVPEYPAAYNLGNILSVAATDAFDALSSFSNYGAVNVDVAAPGTAIYSTTPRTQTFTMMNNNVSAMYGTLSGTSMATPIVSGMAALILQRNGSLTAADVKNAIMGTVDILPALAGKCQTGGRVNLDRALANTPASWISVTQSSLTLAPGASQSVTVRANPSGLAAGTWQGDVILRAPGFPDKTIPVTMSISSCVSIMGPVSIDFGNAWTGYPVNGYMRLANTCNSDLNVTAINSSHPAFSANTAFPIRIGPFSSNDVPLRMLSATAGTFNGTLSVISNAQNLPTMNIPATGRVMVPPRLTASPASLTGTAAAGASANVTLTLGNTGTSNLTGTLSAATLDNGDWLSVTPASINVAAGSSANVTVKLNAAALLGGTYSGSALLTHNDPAATDPYIVPVTFTVTGVKQLSVNPTSLTLGLQSTNRNTAFTRKTLGTTFPLYSNARVADMDGDGDPDLVVCNENYRGNKPAILWMENRNSHTGKWIPHTVVEKNTTANYFYEDIQPVDLDKDGDMDVVAIVGVPFNAGSVVWFEKTPAGYVEHLVTPDIQYGASIKAADMDKDGDIDLISGSSSDDKVSLFINDGHQNFTERILSTTADNAFEVDVGDLDGDDDMDVVSASYNDGKFAWYQNNGAAGYAERFIATVEGAQHAVIHDLDKDGDMDIVYSSLTGGAGWFENVGGGDFSRHQLFQATSDIWFYAVRVADMDNDGDPDLVLGNRNGALYYTTWYENDGNRNFANAHVITDNVDRGFVVADFDGDGDMDIAGGVPVEPASLPAQTLYFCESSFATNAGFLQLNNQGTAPASISALTFSSNRFKSLARLPLVVPPRETVSVAVTYALAGGTKNGTLTIASNASDNPSLNVALNGTDPAIAIPGRIQAEDYRSGGEGVGYHDLTAGNTGAAYRTDDVDIQAATDAGGGYNVGWTQAGEWLQYDVNVAQTGLYNFTARLASATAGAKTVAVTVDGAAAATFSFTDATGWQSWKDYVVGNVRLTAGAHLLRITMATANFNINYLDVAAKPNVAPVSNAGSDRTVTVNTTVTLDGRASSDADNAPQPLSYAWTQVSGPATTLNGAGTAQPSYTPTVTGTYVFRLTVSDGAASGFDDVTVNVTPPVVGIPLPGRIQAEDYRSGGEGVGYHDLTAGNTGAAYRTDDVDIQAATDAGGGYNVGWTQAGEWLQYDVNVAQTGLYNFTARLASATAGTKTVAVTVDGAAAATFSFTDATGWQSWKDYVVNNVSLTSGPHVLRITMATANFNINYLDVAAKVNAAPSANAGPDRTVTVNTAVTLDGRGSSDPDNGPQALSYSWSQVSGPAVTLNNAASSQPGFTPTATGAYVFRLTVSDGAATAADDVSITVNSAPIGIALPGRIQAEDYKAGGEGVGYHDLTAGNSGAAYRTDDVDIQATTDAGGGYNVGWTQAGEWLAYDVSVAQTGLYNLTARLASATAGTKSITYYLDGIAIGTIGYTDATGWQSWKTATLSNINLTAGGHVLRINFTTADLNVNYVDVAAATAPELILNGNFSNGLNSWTTAATSGSAATFSNDAGSAKIAITNVGINPWDIQLYQQVSLASGKLYTLEFDIKAEATPKNFKVVVEHNADPWTKYHERQYTVTAAANTYQHFKITWTQPATDATVRLGFHFGITNLNDVWLDNVSLK
jgi:hypothetical protein